MSNRRRLDGRGQPEEDYEWVMMPGACLDDPGEIARMRRLTHDAVVAGAGAGRRSGVRWLHWHGAAAATEFEKQYADRDRLPAAHPAAELAAVDQMRAFLVEHGERAVLIVAMCEVTSGG